MKGVIEEQNKQRRVTCKTCYAKITKEKETKETKIINKRTNLYSPGCMGEQCVKNALKNCINDLL